MVKLILPMAILMVVSLSFVVHLGLQHTSNGHGFSLRFELQIEGCKTDGKGKPLVPLVKVFLCQ